MKKKMIDEDDFDRVPADDVELGPGSGGQSGDLQDIDSEDVAELLEDGQSFEASVLSGIENAPNSDESGIRTREVPEDDVPLEYLEDEQGNRP